MREGEREGGERKRERENMGEGDKQRTNWRQRLMLCPISSLHPRLFLTVRISW